MNLIERCFKKKISKNISAYVIFLLNADWYLTLVSRETDMKVVWDQELLSQSDPGLLN